MVVDDNCVVVVREGAQADDADPGLAGSEGEAVDEGVIGFAVRAHEEAALGAATRDHVAATWDDGARKGHAEIVGNDATQVACRGQILGPPRFRGPVLCPLRRGPFCCESHDKKVNLGEVFPGEVLPLLVRISREKGQPR